MVKNYILTIVLLIGTGHLWSQTTTIPDVNFEQALIDLGVDSDGIINGSVLTSDISSITFLDVSNRNISDLGGIEFFVNLKELNCSNNQLTSLNLPKDDFENCSVTPDDSTLASLEILDCSSNQITTLDLKKNFKLKKLNCENNLITQLETSSDCTPLGGCNFMGAALEYINCENNLLSSLDFQLKNYNLKELICDNNQLTNLALPNDILTNECITAGNQFVSLSIISCDNNQLSSLDLSNNSMLTKLSINSNNLNVLNLKNGNTHNIIELDVLNNPDLRCLVVDNPAKAINEVTPYDSWEKDSSTLYSNYGDCSPVTLIPDYNFEQALIDLGIDRDTDNYQIPNGSIATSDIIGITELFIEDNNISDLTGIEGFTNLTTLWCSQNQLSEINISKNKLLTDFNGSDNQLTNLSLTENTLLKFLRLANNQIESLNVEMLTELITLECSRNELINIDLSVNIKLRNILIDSNSKLESINLKNGNNLNFDDVRLYVNPVLSCISVDDYVAANAGDHPYSGWLLLGSDNATYYDNCFPTITSSNFEQVLIDQGIDSDIIANNEIAIADAVKVMELDISSKNIEDISGIEYFKNLENLNCSNNNLINLDLSKNKKLKQLDLSNNQLETLDVKNGQNNIVVSFDAANNTILTCIQVDNATSANIGIAPYDTWIKDPIATYSEDCKSALDVDDEILNSAISIFPNPASNTLIIKSNNLQLIRVEVYSIHGKKIKEVESDFSNINISHLSSGLYLTKIYSEQGTTFRKIIKN